MAVTVSSGYREAVMNHLFEQGSTGCEEREKAVIAYFPGTRSEKAILENFNRYVKNLQADQMPVLSVEIRRIPNEDWGRNWQKHFRPVRVTEGIVVKPPWEKWTAAPDETVIDIMPRMAFGTGTHESTQLCLRLMRPVKTCRVLDVGSGSGILAVAAARLGAAQVTALEIDINALPNTRENCLLNGVASGVQIIGGEPAALVPVLYDLIFANINRNVLLEILPDLTSRLNRAGRMVLSGFLITDEPVMKKAAGDAGLTVCHVERLNEWSAVSARLNRDGTGSRSEP